MNYRISGRLRALLTGLAVAAATALAAAPATAQVAGDELSAELEAVRAATERFRDVRVAVAEGYVPDPTGMCVMAEHEGLPRQLGGMGIHYVRPDLLEITETSPVVKGSGTHTDFWEPAVLVYMPNQEGELVLGAVENLVFADDWHAEGHEGPPEFAGNQYFTMWENPETEALEAHGFEPHYELHVWLFVDNPSGTFVPFNPAVECPEEIPPLPGASG